MPVIVKPRIVKGLPRKTKVIALLRFVRHGVQGLTVIVPIQIVKALYGKAGVTVLRPSVKPLPLGIRIIVVNES